MQGTRILALKISIIVPLFVLAMWLSTQLFAQTFGYHHQLGDPLAHINGYVLYKPWMIFWWMFKAHGLVLQLQNKF